MTTAHGQPSTAREVETHLCSLLIVWDLDRSTYMYTTTYRDDLLVRSRLTLHNCLRPSAAQFFDSYHDGRGPDYKNSKAATRATGIRTRNNIKTSNTATALCTPTTPQNTQRESCKSSSHLDVNRVPYKLWIIMSPLSQPSISEALLCRTPYLRVRVRGLVEESPRNFLDFLHVRKSPDTWTTKARAPSRQKGRPVGQFTNILAPRESGEGGPCTTPRVGYDTLPQTRFHAYNKRGDNSPPRSPALANRRVSTTWTVLMYDMYT